MSEFNPFSAGVVEEEPVLAAEEGGASNSNRRAMLAVGGLSAVALAAGAVFFLGIGGGSDEDEAFVPVKRAPRPAATEPATAGAATAAKLPGKTNLQLGRNPFRALYIQPPPPPPAPAETQAPELPLFGFPVDGSSPQAPGRPVPGTGVNTGNGTAPQQPTAQEHKLVLLRVFGEGKDQSASFSIDGKQQTAKVGTTFGPSAEILLLSLQQGPKDDQWTAVLQVGDGDPFDVVTGEPVFVR